jgi:hypothetical protein
MSDDQELIQAARQAFSTFVEIAGMVNDQPCEEDVPDIVDEIYARGFDVGDSLSYSHAWHAVKDRRQQQEERRAQYNRSREEYLSPAVEMREKAIEEFRQQQRPITKIPFIPDRQYSEEEIERMPSDEYRKKILGALRLEDIQDQSSVVAAPERPPRRKIPLTLRALNKRLRNP